mmetsp:Transcript_3712/g.9366  ORF Transcript_3712/g.9366 Transcript_3712/m.9366 type:complete len:251 (-) Transcript_3712:785-1537(-)
MDFDPIYTIPACDLEGKVLHAFHEGDVWDHLLVAPLPRHLHEEEEALDGQAAAASVVQQRGGSLDLLLPDRLDVAQHSLHALRVQVGHVERHVEHVRHLHRLHHRSQARCPDTHEPPAQRRLLLQQHEQRLQHRIRKPRPDRHILEDSFDVVQDDNAEGTLVGVVEDFDHVADLGGLRVADHVFCADELDEGRVRLEGQAGGHGRLPAARGALQQHRHHRSLGAVLHLVHQGLTRLGQVVKLRPVRDDSL